MHRAAAQRTLLALLDLRPAARPGDGGSQSSISLPTKTDSRHPLLSSFRLPSLTGGRSALHSRCCSRGRQNLELQHVAFLEPSHGPLVGHPGKRTGAHPWQSRFSARTAVSPSGPAPLLLLSIPPNNMSISRPLQTFPSSTSRTAHPRSSRRPRA